MREIKFRAWHTVQKKMYSAETLGADQMTLSADGRGFINVSGDAFHLSQFAGEKMIPLQYTGLKDKTGVEIYEGDIVRISLPGFGIEKDLVVEWEDGKYKEPMFEDFHREVIGNIYENKEV
uniref:Putative YopX protein n=1 Tax=viral metagenome TaxID=1070528 RepID=A0A6M3J3L9_9ZZZZ